MYRRTALPVPPFPKHFTGYSLLEDLTLSLTVGKNWQLANARTARIFHDTQPGEHKRSAREMAQMELVNRHYVMTRVLHRRDLSNHLRLALLELFGIVTPLRSAHAWKTLPSVVAGKIAGIWSIAQGPQEVSSKESLSPGYHPSVNREGN
jgi:hypothetical protein